MVRQSMWDVLRWWMAALQNSAQVTYYQFLLHQGGIPASRQPALLFREDGNNNSPLHLSPALPPPVSSPSPPSSLHLSTPLSSPLYHLQGSPEEGCQWDLQGGLHSPSGGVLTPSCEHLGHPLPPSLQRRWFPHRRIHHPLAGSRHLRFKNVFKECPIIRPKALSTNCLKQLILRIGHC